MYIVYYDKNAQFGSNSGISGVYVKIHKQGCPHHTKNDDDIEKHSGERPLPEFATLIEACEYVEGKAGKLSSKFFCKHCFGKG